MHQIQVYIECWQKSAVQANVATFQLKVVAVGGIVGFGYQVGKDLASRDNQLQCKAEQ